MENHGGMISTGKAWFFHQSFLAILSAESSGIKAVGTANEMTNLAYEMFL
jgi:hypothetical protein